MNAAEYLHARADSYSTDAMLLRKYGSPDDAVLYETIRDELRRCAEQISEKVTS